MNLRIRAYYETIQLRNPCEKTELSKLSSNTSLPDVLMRLA
jgi:hypothetical protein